MTRPRREGCSTQHSNSKSRLEAPSARKRTRASGSLQTFSGGLKNVAISGDGDVNLLTGRYASELTATVFGDISISDSIETVDGTGQSTDASSTKESACTINERYRDIGWPIHCSGQFNNPIATTTQHNRSTKTASGPDCNINRSRLSKVIRDTGKAKALEKAQEKLEDKLKDKLGDGVGDEVKDILKKGLEGLFR